MFGTTDEILEEKRMRHIESFVKNDQHDYKITSGANKVFYKEVGPKFLSPTKFPSTEVQNE